MSRICPTGDIQRFFILGGARNSFSKTLKAIHFKSLKCKN
jgi:hypothetical protein